MCLACEGRGGEWWGGVGWGGVGCEVMPFSGLVVNPFIRWDFFFETRARHCDGAMTGGWELLGAHGE